MIESRIHNIFCTLIFMVFISAKEPKLTAAMVRHNGCVNRIRSYNFGEVVLAANWSERGAVHIWNLNDQLKATTDKQAMNNFIKNVQKKVKPVYSFEGFTNEGYALDWSTVNKGSSFTGKYVFSTVTFRTFIDW